jgi:TonB family protein
LKRSEPPVSTDPGKKYFGTVTFVAVISDKGYVCSARVAHGIDREFDKKAGKAVREWHFDPAQKDGHTVTVVVRIDVNYWTTSSGEIVSDPPQLPVKEAK